MAKSTTIYPLQESTTVDVGSNPVGLTVDGTNQTVESTTQPNPVTIVVPSATVYTAGIQGPPGPPTGIAQEVEGLPFVGSGVGPTKTQTSIHLNTMYEAFGVSDELYLLWAFPEGLDRTKPAYLEGSFFTETDQPGTTCSWEIYITSHDHATGADIDGVVYANDLPLQDTAFTHAHGSATLDNAIYFIGDTDTIHIRLKRVASAADPTGKIGVSDVLIRYSTDGKVGAAGADGADGASGAASYEYNAVAGENLGTGDVVRIDGGVAYISDKDAVTHIGETIGLVKAAVTSGQPVVINIGGEFTDVGWTWVPGTVFLSTAGALTQTAPSTGILQKIGTVLTSTSILIDIDDPVLRA